MILNIFLLNLNMVNLLFNETNTITGVLNYKYFLVFHKTMKKGIAKIFRKYVSGKLIFETNLQSL